MPVSDDINKKAREVWNVMDGDMREFVSALVELGLVDGRAGLAKTRVAVLPEKLVMPDGVQPCIVTKAERAVLDAIKAKRERRG